MNVVEATISDLRSALERGEITCVDLTTAYLDRIDKFDRNGPCLNAVPVLNPYALVEAQASDDRRQCGCSWATDDLAIDASEVQQRYYATRETDFVLIKMVQDMSENEELNHRLFFSNETIKKCTSFDTMDRTKVNLQIDI